MNWLHLSVALGIGLLVGAERERRKGTGPVRRAAGIRSFATMALLGAVAELLDHPYLVTASLVTASGFAWLSHARSDIEDPGMTTEIALVLTCLLGALSIQNPPLAAGLGITLTGLLAARDWLHQFVLRMLSEQELHDVILFGAALLIILPIAPDRYIGPWEAINLHKIAAFVVMVMGISALGYIARRLFGHRGGLPLSGFLGGFVSSSAVIMTMGHLSRQAPAHQYSAISGALFSNLATMVQLYLVFSLSATHASTTLLYPILYGATTALVLALLFLLKPTSPAVTESTNIKGHAFDWRSTAVLTIIVTALTLASAGLHAWYGEQGVWVASAVAGLADAQSNIASITALQSKGVLTAAQVQTAILLGFTSNALTKVSLALFFGSTPYKIYTVSGVLLVTAATWIGVVLHPM